MVGDKLVRIVEKEEKGDVRISYPQVIAETAIK
jgi:hypothetical protein